MKTNPFAERLQAFRTVLRKREVDLALIFNQANVKALTGVDCDNACLVIRAESEQVLFLTDFRYVPAVERLAPWVKIGDIRKVTGKQPFRLGKQPIRCVGYEPSMAHARYLNLEKTFPGAKFVDILGDFLDLRAVKTPEERAGLRASAALNDKIWTEAQKQFKPGMTERAMARVIQHLMLEWGEGEAFETIVCVGANAAECHHIPDDTVWDGKAPVLVDMGVKLNGICSDMTRNLIPARPSKLYQKVYNLVREANERAIAAVKPGMKASALDRVARDFLTKNGFGKAFGHSLGHGVGIEIHEMPWIAKTQKTILKPGMSLTIEPGVYLPGNLGVRVEDLVLVTETGCEVLSHSVK